jgi:hypothetical protein
MFASYRQNLPFPKLACPARSTSNELQEALVTLTALINGAGLAEVKHLTIVVS